MARHRTRKKSSVSLSGRRKRKFSIGDDPFFNSVSDRKHQKLEEEIGSEESEGEPGLSSAKVEEEDEEEVAAETADEKRLRVAKEYLEKIRAITKREEEEEEEEVVHGGGGGADREGKRDLLVAEKLRQEQLEASGRLRRLIASRVHKPEAGDDFKVLQKHRQTVTAVALSEDDSRGFSASKDGTILHWDINSGKSEKYLWPNKEVLISHGAKNPQNPATKWSKRILALAASSDGRYLATGGLDRHVHLWDVRTREHIWAFPGHRGPVSCLTFRVGTSELISGSFDRSLKLWNVEDRAFIEPLFGHQAEVLHLDCLHKERVLSVARDRTMHLWKVAEAKQLIFRAPASNLECCCFISDDEFLSGSDEGSVELWSVVRKKPVCVVKNAHPRFSHGKLCMRESELKENGMAVDEEKLENGRSIPVSCSSVQSWVGAVGVCRGSDLAVSGAANGIVRLWAVENSAKSIRSLFDLYLTGFVNSLVFAKSGNFLLAGVGQEPRLGRWGRVLEAQNGVHIQSLKLSE